MVSTNVRQKNVRSTCSSSFFSGYDFTISLESKLQEENLQFIEMQQYCITVKNLSLLKELRIRPRQISFKIIRLQENWFSSSAPISICICPSLMCSICKSNKCVDLHVPCKLYLKSSNAFQDFRHVQLRFLSPLVPINLHKGRQQFRDTERIYQNECIWCKRN